MRRFLLLLALIVTTFCCGCITPDPDFRKVPEYDPAHPERGGVI
jgi:hypothetical protein